MLANVVPYVHKQFCFTLQQTILHINTCYNITENWQLYLITAECHWSLLGFLLGSKIPLYSIV